jgi:vacuolar-type H+-ATPase subunit I/STV1
MIPTRRSRRHLTAVEVKDYLEKHDLQRKVEEMIAQVFELQPEEPIPYMVAYLRKHAAAPDYSAEDSIWQKKYQELARVAAEREAALAARTADLERELRSLAEISLRGENSTLAIENSRLEQENAMLKLAAENQRLAAENERLMAYSTHGMSVDLDAAEPYMFGQLVDSQPAYDAEVSAEKPSEAPEDAEDVDHHAHAAITEASRLAKRFTLDSLHLDSLQVPSS